MTRLSEIRSRAEAATPGPWQACHEDRVIWGPCVCGQVWSIPVDQPIGTLNAEWGDHGLDGRLIPYGDLGRKDQQANMLFVAKSREDVPWLLEVVEKLLPAAKFVYRMNHGEILNAEDFAKIAEVGLPDDIKALLNDQS